MAHEHCRRAGRALPQAAYAELDDLLGEADEALAVQYPGDARGRQPVHTVYVPADAYTGDLPARWGSLALQALAQHGYPMDEEIRSRVVAKLESEPIEDLRIDVEDGYGKRADDAEDRDVVAAATALGASVANGSAPPFVGLRFKCFEAPTRRRGVRSLDLFLATLLETGPLPAGFTMTLPKVSLVEQVQAMVMLCDHLEVVHGLDAGRLRFEVQVETPQVVLGADGAATVARIVHAGAARISGLHYGTYDYSASVGISAAYQSMAHPAADYAKAVMQVAAAGTGVRLSDGSTNILPVGDAGAVRAAWDLHASLVRRSLERGFYQGWDLHPAQLVTRYAATFAFFRDGVDAATARVRDYMDRRSSGVLDEPATAVALAGFLLRGMHCGATDPADITKATGLTESQLTDLSRRILAVSG